MPIPYTCPHCSKQFSVADQFAGQTGPCAACGQPITIPVPPGYPHPAQAGSKGSPGVLIALLAVIAVGGEPRDVDISQPMSLPAGNHPNVNLGVFYDGHTQAIPKQVSPQQIRAMATRSGDEVIEDF
jgi:hypothetical protein